MSKTKSRHFCLISAVSLVTLLICSGTLAADDATVEKPEREDFTVAWLSDTQSMIYYDDLEGTYSAVIDHIISEKEEKNIIAVVHTGDIVEDAFIAKEWEEPDRGASELNAAGIEFFPNAGNHDIGNSEFFNWKWYQERPFIQVLRERGYEVYENGKGISKVLEQNGKTFLFVGLGYYQAFKFPECYEWMKQQFKDHPDAVGILVLHSYIAPDGGRGIDARRLNQYVIPECPNLRLILCGHASGSKRMEEHYDFDGDGEAETNVHVLRFDAQGSSSKRVGFIRFLTFHTEDGSLDVTSYSPINGTDTQPHEKYEDGNFRIENLF